MLASAMPSCDGINAKHKIDNYNNMKDVKTIVAEAQEAMGMAVEYLEDALAHIRAGKADVRLLALQAATMVPTSTLTGKRRKVAA